LPLLLVPPAVGVMVYAKDIAADFWAIVGALVLSLVIAMGFVGVLMQNWSSARRSRRSNHDLRLARRMGGGDSSSLFGIGITLGAYQLVLAGFEKTRWIFLQPVLVSMLLVIGVLLTCGLSYAEYRKSTRS